MPVGTTLIRDAPQASRYCPSISESACTKTSLSCLRTSAIAARNSSICADPSQPVSGRITTALTAGSPAALPKRVTRSFNETPGGPNNCSRSSAGTSVSGPSSRKTATMLRGFSSTVCWAAWPFAHGAASARVAASINARPTLHRTVPAARSVWSAASLLALSAGAGRPKAGASSAHSKRFAQFGLRGLFPP